ncbi:glycogen debranching enzyme [Curtobacterium sp. MCBD17_035]|uniref:glycogen debranching protein n=1 Tax=Curtobacterium sp. MCBD17_035 TaxID=2175673 RepID=UPI000DA783B7|nr:alpha-amylase family glycosyl hydrolase [Curtobacterium sp. MCBD17_035]WIB66263.1 glycogen debranching enzyme [Curtobacterium sp. MCBD17_035]
MQTVDIVPEPGLRPDADGASFAVRSATATAVTLVVDASASHGPIRVPLQRDGDVWTGRADGARVGDTYHLLADGPRGARDDFDPLRPLLDPYARGIEPAGDGWTSVVVDEGFDWGGVPKPGTPVDRTVLYEAHVRTLTAGNPAVPEHLRGTYAGLAHESTIAHLRRLGVTAVELLPVHAFRSEEWLRRAGRENAWGYNTLGFHAPHAPYASASARAAGATAVLREFKGMVRLLHEAGIEVVLDVVYNHTAEEGLGGPTSGLRGLDGATAYRWAEEPAAGAERYFDTSGCGNTLDTSQPAIADLVVDSLRYWAREVQVDGFRFDLMAALARDAHHRFDPAHPLLQRLRDDPLLQDVKLIAEPWDVGPDGWRTGAFGPRIAEWNDGFRDTVRQFWLTDIARERRDGSPMTGIGALAGVLAGSRHVFGADRGPTAAVNFVTAHDGFTMRDLVSYDHKHNEANGEDNRDGTDDNRSFNHGVEGPTDDRGVRAARQRSLRNLMGTLLLSAGVPMITAGDERGRTQHGNNNPYAITDASMWVDWSPDPDVEWMVEQTAALVRLRAAHPALRPSRFGTDGADTPSATRMTWYATDGTPMTDDRWDEPTHRALQYFAESTPEDEPDDRVLVIVHGSGRTRDMTLPAHGDVDAYRLVWSSEKHRDHERHRSVGAVFTAYGPGIHVFEIV